MFQKVLNLNPPFVRQHYVPRMKAEGLSEIIDADIHCYHMHAYEYVKVVTYISLIFVRVSYAQMALKVENLTKLEPGIIDSLLKYFNSKWN